MLKGNTKLLGLAVLGSALGFAGCSSTAPLHVIVDPSLATAEVYEVDGLTNYYWSKPIKFGPFRTEKTRVGETWTWTTEIFSVEAGDKELGVEKGTVGKPYRFVFVGEKGETWQVDCRAKTPIVGWRTRHSEGSVATGETRLGCAMRDPAGVVHSLALHGRGPDFRGEARFGDSVIAIRALHDVPDRDGKPFSIPGSLGYELRQDEHVIASVDLLGKGRVYLARELPAESRAPVAMAATVLLFFHES
jgi:hypothetical protein